MRHIISTALVAVIVSALTVTVTGALAREPAQAPADERAIEVAGLNADTVDGRHAIKATWKKQLRRNKLVATNRQGLLPSNIVKPRWGLLRNVPAGFADGVDNAGVTGVKLTRVSVARTVDGAVGSSGYINVNCPAGSKVSGGGFTQSGPALDVRTSAAFNDASWTVRYVQAAAGETVIAGFAVCLSVDPAGAITTASRKRK